MLIKLVDGCESVLLLDIFFPVSHIFPGSKLLEELQVFNVIIGVTFNQPLTKGMEFDRFVTLICCKTFTRECVVLVTFFIAVLEVDNLQIIRV